ncbi:MAG: hypothetical protein EXQ74_01460 [Thermoleophilia bacterium]|nr:hypothetical protein [Thermoleophilia bacterium]
MDDVETFDPDGRFRAALAASSLLDPMPGLTALATSLGVDVDGVVHHALVRWSSAGSEALLAGAPEMLLALRDAAATGDLERVRGITDALLASWAPDDTA